MSTIVAGNSATNSLDVYGTLTSQGHNLIGTTNDVLGLVASDITNTNALLGPLQNNSGPTLTHPLLPGSPAIDAGTGVGAPSVDQRGFPRPSEMESISVPASFAVPRKVFCLRTAKCGFNSFLSRTKAISFRRARIFRAGKRSRRFPKIRAANFSLKTRRICANAFIGRCYPRERVLRGADLRSAGEGNLRLPVALPRWR